MPVYLCRPGLDTPEPWRHGIQVFAAPFDFVADDAAAAPPAPAGAVGGGGGGGNFEPRTDLVCGAEPTVAAAPAVEDLGNVHATVHNDAAEAENNGNDDDDGAPPADTGVPRFAALQQYDIRGGGGGAAPQHSVLQYTQSARQPRGPSRAVLLNQRQNNSHHNHRNVVLRRVRHSEIVLVDDVCVYAGRYWLRLRWPGHRGGFAGYIAMGRVGDDTMKYVAIIAEHGGEGTECLNVICVILHSWSVANLFYFLKLLRLNFLSQITPQIRRPPKSSSPFQIRTTTVKMKTRRAKKPDPCLRRNPLKEKTFAA